MKNLFASLAIVGLIAFSSCGGAKKEEVKNEEVTQPTSEAPVAEPTMQDSTQVQPTTEGETK